MIFSQALIWSLFPIVTILSYGKLPSLIAFAWTTALSAVFFAIIISFRGKWHEIKNLNLWKYVAMVALFIGVLFYGFYFVGLSKTSAGNASIVAQMEVFTSFLFFNIWKKEKISLNYILGGLLMVLGVFIVLYPKFSGVALGDLLVLCATFFAPVGNFFQKKARKEASSETVMFLRTLISAPIIFLIAFMLGIYGDANLIKISFPFLLLNGFLILGMSKMLWVEGIHRISVTKAIALSSIAPLATLLLSWIFLHQPPTIWQLASLVPIIFGVMLLTDNLKFKKS